MVGLGTLVPKAFFGKETRSALCVAKVLLCGQLCAHTTHLARFRGLCGGPLHRRAAESAKRQAGSFFLSLAMAREGPRAQTPPWEPLGYIYIYIYKNTHTLFKNEHEL